MKTCNTMNKTSIWIFVSIFLVYLVFTSGLYYWASGCKVTDKLVTPYSLALSAEETGLAGIATKSDIDCVNWLLEKSDKNLKIAGDTNGHCILMGYFEEGRRIILLEPFHGEEHCYLFLTHQDTESGLFILPDNMGEGLRVKHPFILTPDKIYYEVSQSTKSYQVECRADATTVIFRSGDSIVIEK
jgi:uncharacterized membrane protein